MAILSVSGVRGIIGYDLDYLDLIRIIRAFGKTMLKKNSSLVVGRDTRTSSDMVSNTVISTLLEMGFDVYDFGKISTPAVFREVCRSDLYQGGLVITSSHNPPEWNGLKFIIRGRGMFENEVKNLKKITYPSPTKIGKFFSQNLSHYQDDLISRVGKYSCSKIKVALDMGGGVGSLFIPRVFKKIGCEIVSINYIPSNFSRVIDPVVDDLQELSSAVLKNSCQVGFAYDCDADRVVIIDEKGRKLSGDITLMLCIKHALKKGRIRKIIVSTDTTKGIQEMGENHGVQVVYTKVGESNVVKEMIECGAYIGGEGSSGGVIFSDFVLCRDGVLASSIIAKMIEEEGDLSNIIKELPKYYQLRKSVQSSPNKFKKIINMIYQRFPNSDLIDGIKFYPTNNSWVLIRPSNTEKIIRISVEAKSKSQAIQIMNYYIKEIEQNLNEE